MLLTIHDADRGNSQNVKIGHASAQDALCIKFANKIVSAFVPDWRAVRDLIQETGSGIAHELLSIGRHQTGGTIWDQLLADISGVVHHRHKLVNGQLVTDQSGR